MDFGRRGPPPGLRLLSRIGISLGADQHRVLVLVLTFIAYACYHASRKPTSIVKSVLDPEPALDLPWAWRRKNLGGPEFVPSSMVSHDRGSVGNFTLREKVISIPRGVHGDGWAPFDGEDGTAKLGEIDVAFLLFYSAGMYVAGHLGDMLDLRMFLAIGMVGSGVFLALFGMGYFWNVHSLVFYMGMQMAAGLFQATGWPSVVAVVGNWFGKRKRGLIMGIWNAHTSVGNIAGSLLAASVLQLGWGWSFIYPGALIAFGGILVFLFLAAYPEDLGFPSPYQRNGGEVGSEDVEAQRHVRAGKAEKSVIQPSEDSAHIVPRSTAVGMIEACRIPGVITFAFCLFFAKLVAYTFLYWLPFYLSQTAIGGEYLSVQSAANLSTLFDVGGIVGGILAGYISDKLNARAITAASFMYLAIPALFLYRIGGGISKPVNIVLMMIVGLFVNGPYALITTAVSADLGTHSSLKGNSRALATVTAVIDGTGSVGAAIGPLLTGFISRKGWDAVFIMLAIAASTAGLLLTPLVRSEIEEIRGKPRQPENLRPPVIEEPLLRGDQR